MSSEVTNDSGFSLIHIPHILAIGIGSISLLLYAATWLWSLIDPKCKNPNKECPEYYKIRDSTHDVLGFVLLACIIIISIYNRDILIALLFSSMIN